MADENEKRPKTAEEMPYGHWFFDGKNILRKSKINRSETLIYRGSRCVVGVDWRGQVHAIPASERVVPAKPPKHAPEFMP